MLSLLFQDKSIEAVSQHLKALGSGTPKVKLKAARALWNLLLSHPEYRQEIKKLNGMSVLVGALSSSETPLSQNIMGLLISLSEDDGCVEGIKRSGGIKRLIDFLKTSDLVLRQNTVCVLLKISEYEAYKSELHREGVIKSVMPLLRDPDLIVHKTGASICAHLASEPEVQISIAAEGGIAALFSLLDSRDVSVRHSVLSAFKLMSQQKKNQDDIPKDEGMRRIIERLNDGDVSVRALAAESLTALAKEHVENKLRIVKEAGVILLGGMSRAPVDVLVRSCELIATLALADENKAKISQQGAIPLIRALCDHATQEVRREAIVALCHLSIGSPQNQDQVLQCYSIEQMVALLSEREEVIVRMAAAEFMLSLLSSRKIHQKPSIDCGVIAMLLALMTVDRARSVAIRVLQYLSSHELYQSKMKESNAVALLMPVLDGQDEESARQALELLWPMIESDPETRAQLNQSVGMGLWVALLVRKHVQERTLAVLQHLCVDEAMVADFLVKKGVFLLFTVASGTGTLVMRRYAMKLLRHCVNFDCSFSEIAQYGNLRTLIKFLNDADHEIKSLSSEILKRLETKLEYEIQIAKIKGLDALLPLLSTSDGHKRQLALQAVLPLCQPSNYQAIGYQGLRALSNFLKESDEGAWVGVLKAFIGLATTEATQLNIATVIDVGLVLSLLADGKPLGVRQLAARLFECLALPMDNKLRLCTPSAVAYLFLSITDKDVDLCRAGLGGLKALALKPQNRRAFAENNGLAKLLPLLCSKDSEILKQAAALCAYLSEIPEQASSFPDYCVSNVVALLSHGEVSVVQCGATMLANMIRTQAPAVASIKLTLATSDAGGKLVALLGHADLQMRQKVVAIVVNLVSERNFAVSLGKRGIVTPLLALLDEKEKDNEVRQDAAEACFHLFTHHPEHTITLAKTKGPDILYPLLSHTNGSIRSHAVSMFHFLMAHDKNIRQRAVGKGIAKIWATLLADKSQEGIVYHATCMVHLASTDIESRKRIVEDGVVKALLTILGSNLTKIHLEALSALNGLALESGCRKTMGHEGAIPVLLRLLSTDHPVLRQKAMLCLSHLATESENQSKIHAGGGLKKLIEMLSTDPDPVVKQLSVQLIEAFVPNALYASELLSAGCLAACVGALSHANKEVHTGAARAVCAWGTKFVSMTYSVEVKDKIIQQATMDALLSILSPERSAVSGSVMDALCLLSKEPVSLKKIASSQALDRLMAFLADELIDGWPKSIEIFRNICLDGAARSAIQQKRYVGDLIRQAIVRLCDSKVPIQRMASELIQALSLEHGNKEKIASGDGIKHLVAQLSSEDLDVRLGVVETLANLVVDEGYHAAIVASGAVAVLLKWLPVKMRSEKERWLASSILLELGRSGAHLYALIDAGAGPILQQVLMGESHDGIRMNCSKLFQFCQKFLQQPIASSSSLEVRSLASPVQKHFSSSASQKTSSTKVASYESSDIQLSSFEQSIQAQSVSPQKPSGALGLKDHIRRIEPSEVTIGDCLGQGGFGAVYMAQYNFQPVAVKCFAGELPTKQDFKKVIAEIEKMQDLDQQYLVRLLGVIEAPNELPRLVMECGVRGSLFHYLRLNQEILWSWRLRVAEELARGLAYLHDEKVNIVHRDIKSLNVVLDADLHAKWCDFGLATLKQNATATTKGRKGTMNWMAPELFQRNPSVLKESDIWSFGMVLFELAAREVPYKSLGERGILMRLMKHQPETVPESCKHIPRYASLMEACWRQFSERPPAKEMVTVLTEVRATYVDQVTDTRTEAPDGFVSGFVGLTMG